MCGSDPRATAPPPYVPDTIEPVTGMDSCNRVLVVVISLLPKLLKVVAIIYLPYYCFLINLTGMSMLYPVVTPVTLIIESMW